MRLLKDHSRKQLSFHSMGGYRGSGGDSYPFEKLFSIFPNKNEWKTSLYYLEWAVKSERIPHLSATLRSRVLSGDNYVSPIFFLQLFLAVALDRRSVWRGFLPLNHSSSPCMSHLISMHRPGDSRQTAVSNLFKVILDLVAPKFKHNTFLVRAK